MAGHAIPRPHSDWALDLEAEPLSAIALDDDEHELPGPASFEGVARLSVWSAIRGGERDANALTNLAYGTLLPMRFGDHFCSRAEVGAREWLEVRDAIVVPALRLEAGDDPGPYLRARTRWRRVGKTDYLGVSACAVGKVSSASCWDEETCTTPQTCGPIPDLLCVRAIDGVPFEYVHDFGRAGGLHTVRCAERFRQQKFDRAVHGALRSFVAGMAGVGLPLAAILTAGSFCCRCMAKRDGKGAVIKSPSKSNHMFGDAIDVTGVRLRQPAAGLPAVLVSNHDHGPTRAVLLRVEAVLRMAFPVVLDFMWDPVHHDDHFHCDFDKQHGGRGVTVLGRANARFIRAAVATVTGQPWPKFERALDDEIPLARAALARAAGRAPGDLDATAVRFTYQRLLEVIARGRS
ncbi:MAG: extensin family protein [Nannocystaceae bacterium]|nr:extensin family protein [Nannocystaceae bacterium]